MISVTMSGKVERKKSKVKFRKNVRLRKMLANLKQESVEDCLQGTQKGW
jgi:hypothetical protein